MRDANDSSEHALHGEVVPAVDLSELDPTLDAESFANAVSNIVRSASPELARRRATAVWSRQVIAWTRPLLAACSLAAAASIVMISQARTVPAEPIATTDANQPASIAEAIGVPSSIAQMMNGSNDAPPLLFDTPQSR